MKTREEKAFEMYNNGVLEQDALGQLVMEDFSNKVLEKAVERKWVSKEVAEILKSLK